jgi:hypothetical protein
MTLPNKRVLGLIVGAAVLVILAALALNPVQKKEPHPPPTPQQAAQNQCTLKVYQDYLKNQTARPTDVEKLLSVESILAERRLQERFCLQFVECLTDHDNQQAAIIKGAQFSRCLEDEALEEYDAVPREEAATGGE